MVQYLKLKAKLEEDLGLDHVYFQPPNGMKMSYPCVVFELSEMNAQHADDLPFRVDTEYEVTYIDPNPDSSVPDQIIKFPLCRFNRFFTSDNLNHYVFTLYFKEE